MAKNPYCPKCKEYGESQAKFCNKCGGKMIPLMRIVIMPFVESDQDPEGLGDFRQLVEREGELQPSQAIGCQLYMSSDLEKGRLMASQKESYFAQAEAVLPRLVKGVLDPLGFYDIPDPSEVDTVTQQAANVPTELFVLIQSKYDPEYLFLPEVNYFFFRYPRLHTTGTGADGGFGFVHISAFLLDNRENRVVSRGSGSGINAFMTGDAAIDENYVISVEQQMETMIQAGVRAVDGLLKNMKMVH
ncbi:MAG: hypothetical protein A2W01_08430 [Candidatus Solincola sediminis]|nr:MAG: hypothetical protein A2W01_08430 [Candidatus Solincola sediminis]